MSIPPSSPLANPLDVLIALSHGEVIDRTDSDSDKAAKFYIKCILLDKLRQKNTTEWMNREHLLQKAQQKIKCNALRNKHIRKRNKKIEHLINFEE